MKVLLLEHPRIINPARCNDIANTPLLSCLLSGYAAGALDRCGHEVQIVEGYLDRLSYCEINRIAGDLQPDILGVHMVYHWKDDHDLYSFLRQVKAAGLIRHITVFGFYPTFAYEEICANCQAIDSVILGEPEITFTELAAALSAGDIPSQTPGLVLRSESRRTITIRRPPADDLDALPFPARTEALYRLGEVNILGSRGCYGGCTFCYINPFFGEGSCWRGRSPENITAEIDRIIAQRGSRDFYFVDPNFFGPGSRCQERVLRLSQLLRSRNIRFGIEGRVNDIHERTIASLAEAGLHQILIGLESGKDSSLQRLNKRTTVAQNEAAVRILRNYGIEPNIGFIMFEPDSNLEDIRSNFEFLQRNHLLRNPAITANVLYHNQIVLRGTAAYHRLYRAGRLLVKSSAAYEGTPIFSSPEVESLAELMRSITNHVFLNMSDIWSGKAKQTEEISRKTAMLNKYLVETFEANLHDLEIGKRLSREEMPDLINDAKHKLDSILR